MMRKEWRGGGEKGKEAGMAMRGGRRMGMREGGGEKGMEAGMGMRGGGGGRMGMRGGGGRWGWRWKRKWRWRMEGGMECGKRFVYLCEFIMSGFHGQPWRVEYEEKGVLADYH